MNSMNSNEGYCCNCIELGKHYWDKAFSIA
jgi:hypothetical protein